MLMHLINWTIGLIWVVLATIGWFTLVPGVVSAMVFAWLNGAVVLGLAGLFITRSSRPTRSMAGILYDAEHEEKKPAR